jgi:hypothetical protein
LSLASTITYAQEGEVIFFENFEDNDLEPELTAVPNVSGENGIVEIRNFDKGLGLGGYDIRLGKSQDGNGLTVNALDLSLDLSTYADSELELSFWFAHFFDETQFEDGVFFSDDGGASFTRAIALDPDKWLNDTYGSFPVFDLDSLIRKAGLSFSNQFVIRFQQSGIDDFNVRFGEDGLFLDDILVKVADPITYATLPYSDDFEDGLGISWKVGYAQLDESGNAIPGTTPASNIYIDDDGGRNESDALALGKRYDDNNVNFTKADLHLDLSTYADSELELSFWFKHFFDETQFEDGIFMSDNNGASFTRVIALDPDKWLNNVGGSFPVFDLDSLIRKAGLSFSNQFVIRFQQSGVDDFNTRFGEDGMFLDDILIKVADPITYVTLPYSDDFEDGLGSSWKIAYAQLDDEGNAIAGTTPANNIYIDDDGGRNESDALALGKRYDDNNVNFAKADLHLDLSTYADSELELSFWFAHFFDETQFEDGIFMSDNNGASFTRVIALVPERWKNNTYGSFPVFDLDSLIRKAGLSFSNQFVIRFQQSGVDDFNGFRADNADGLILDDILVKVADPITYATLPYSDDFEDGLGSSWKIAYAQLDDEGNAMTGTTPANKIYIDDDDGSNGSDALALGKRYDDNNVNFAKADLHLDLSTYADSELELSFWFKHFYDETQFEDGIFFSDDGGASFTRAIALDPDKWLNYVGGSFPVFDLDSLIRKAGLSFSNQFVIRFQQSGVDDFSGFRADNADGMFLDDILVKVADPVVYATLPYSDDFEDGLGSSWKVAYAQLDDEGNAMAGTTPANFVEVFSESPFIGVINVTANLRLGKRYDDQNKNTAAIDLYLNLANTADNTLDLKFDIFNFFDESDPEDGLFFSADAGASFTRIYSFDPDNLLLRQYETIELNLQELLASESITPTATSVLRFQQSGTGSFNNFGIGDGLIFDNIVITSGSLPAPVLAEPTVSGTSISLSWTHDSEDETGFYITRQEGNVDPVTIDTVAANVFTYSDTGLMPEQTYTYTVVAFNDNESAASEPKSATTEEAPVVTIAAPTNFNVELIGLTARLTWQDNADNEDGYVIYRGLSSVNEPEILTPDGLAPNTEEYFDTELESETTYYYWVRAYQQPDIVADVGPFEISTTDIVTSINDLEETEGLRLYPIPAGKVLNLEMADETIGEVEISLLNQMGQVVSTQKLNKRSKSLESSFDMSGLSKGVYFLRITQSDQVKVQRILKE